MNDKDIQQEIESLKSKLTGNMIEDMEIRDTISLLFSDSISCGYLQSSGRSSADIIMYSGYIMT